jgi:hypothetical protein
MKEKQARNWNRMSRFGMVGFLLYWFGGVMVGVGISHFIFGYDWINMIPTVTGLIIGGTPLQLLAWKRNKKSINITRL